VDVVVVVIIVVGVGAEWTAVDFLLFVVGYYCCGIGSGGD